MKVVESAIRFPVRVAVGALLLVLFGTLALTRIPVQPYAVRLATAS